MVAEPKVRIPTTGKESRDNYASCAVRYWLIDLASDDPELPGA
jgi:hypothetical protein